LVLLDHKRYPASADRTQHRDRFRWRGSILFRDLQQPLLVLNAHRVDADQRAIRRMTLETVSRSLTTLKNMTMKCANRSTD
jgi:hypothetical protein